jgi:hypothetical protein
MSFEEVLDLTPYQIAALLTEKSTPPGEVDPDVYMRVMNNARSIASSMEN